MQFEILGNTYKFDSLKDITLVQLIELTELKETSNVNYIVDYVHILTGITKGELLRANAADLALIVNTVNEIIGKGDYEKTPYIFLKGKRLKLPKWKVEAKAIFTDLSLQRYALMEQLATSIKGVEQGEQDKLAALLACLYVSPNETFTDELFLERKEQFLNADLNTVYNAFFLQQKRLTKYMRYISYYLKVLEILLKGEKKRRKLFQKFNTILKGQG